MLYLKVKILNLYNLLCDKSSREISSSVIKLSDKNFYICFKNKINTIQLISKPVECFENSLTLSLSSIIILLCLTLNTTLILSNSPLSFLIKLSYHTPLSLQTSVNSNINLSKFRAVLDFDQGRCMCQGIFQSFYSFVLFRTLIPLNILLEETVYRFSDN